MDPEAATLLRRISDARLQASKQPRRPDGSNRIDAVLDSVYHYVDSIMFSKDGYAIPDKERVVIAATGGSATYGQIEPPGVRTMLKHLCLDASSVFCDLGSGNGRALLHVAAACARTSAAPRRCVGVELSATRHECAELALERLNEQHPELLASGPPVELVLSDMSRDGGIPADLTHAYCCTTAFSASLCRDLAQRLARHPTFQLLVTSRQLPLQHHLVKLGEFGCHFSYSASGTAHVYAKSPQAAPDAALAQLWCAAGGDGGDACSGLAWLPPGPLKLLGPLAVEEPLLGPHATVPGWSSSSRDNSASSPSGDPSFN